MKMRKYQFKIIFVRVDQHRKHDKIFFLYWYFNNHKIKIRNFKYKKGVDFNTMKISSQLGAVLVQKYAAPNFPSAI